MANQDFELKLSVLNPLATIFKPKRADQAVEADGARPVQKSDPPVVEFKPLTQFHPFPRMPSELRLKIWKLNVPDERIVELKYSKKIYHAVSSTPAPVLLHVCRESRAEALKHYTLLYNSHYMTPRIFINPQVDILYFSEKRGGEYNEVFIQDESTYFDYFKTMTKNINSTVLMDLCRIALSDETYLGNLEWDIEREDVFSLTKFTNLEIAAIVLDAGKKIDGPVKLVQVTWGQCPIHTAVGRAKPDYDGDEVLHSCNLCGCPFIKEVVLQLNTGHIYFEQLKQGIGAMFANFEKTKLPGWKVPKTKTMVLAEKKRDVKKGQFEFHFKKPKPVNRGRRIPEWANITRGGNRIVRMKMPRARSGSF